MHKHRVEIHYPGEAPYTVLCDLKTPGSIEEAECLDVVRHHQKVAPDGTEIFLERAEGRSFRPSVLWFKARGTWHRQSLKRGTAAHSRARTTMRPNTSAGRASGR